jgi:hypothetical protein
LEIEGVEHGNAVREGAEMGGWFVGQFMPQENRRRTDFELKWGVHPKGEREEHGWVANKTSTTFSVLIEGTFLLRMRAGNRIQEILLKERGDYVIWKPGVEHTWEAPSDCIILSIRCPSVPDDQVRRSS